MKRGIIIVMSANKERFVREEDVVRKTWAKDILDGKYENLSIYFYRGGAEKVSFNEDNRLVSLTSGDELTDTYRKSLEMFQWVQENCGEYDYILKTSTTAYINVEGLIDLMEREEISSDVMYTPNILINNSNRGVPFGGGFCLIMPRAIIEVLLRNKVMEVEKAMDNLCDDCAYGTSLYIKYGSKYMIDHMREVDTIDSLDIPFLDRINNVLAIRVRNNKNPDANIVSMIGLHILYKQFGGKPNIPSPHKYTKVSTVFGDIPIEG